jgi:hypothetical protein
MPASAWNESRHMANELSLKDAFELYETGKHRRYSLLFSVNGGAFAIAKLLFGEPGKPGVVLGGLKLAHLSIGMALLTVVMTADIFAFGSKMRKGYLPGAFDWRGKTVLLLLGVLIVAGWLLVGFG